MMRTFFIYANARLRKMKVKVKENTLTLNLNLNLVALKFFKPCKPAKKEKQRHACHRNFFASRNYFRFELKFYVVFTCRNPHGTQHIVHAEMGRKLSVNISV